MARDRRRGRRDLLPWTLGGALPPTATVEESQIINGTLLARLADNETVTGDWTFSGSLTIPQASVTAHQAALTIAESQITDGAILARVGETETITGDWTFTGTTVVPEATVTDHEQALTILESQIADGAILARLADDETVTGNWTFSGSLTNGAGVTIADGTATITIDGVDGLVAAGSVGLYETGGSLGISSRSSVIIFLDNDNNSTGSVFSVRANSASGGSDVFSVREDGLVTMGTAFPLNANVDLGNSSGGGWRYLYTDTSTTYLRTGEVNNLPGLYSPGEIGIRGDSGLRFRGAAGDISSAFHVGVDTDGHFVAGADSTYNVGTGSVRFATGFFDAVQGRTVSYDEEPNTDTGTQTAWGVNDVGFVVWNGASDITIQGIAAGRPGQILVISVHSANANNLVLADENAGADAANRIQNISANDTTYNAPNAGGSTRRSAVLMYSGTESRWQVIGGIT